MVEKLFQLNFIQTYSHIFRLLDIVFGRCSLKKLFFCYFFTSTLIAYFDVSQQAGDTNLMLNEQLLMEV